MFHSYCYCLEGTPEELKSRAIEIYNGPYKPMDEGCDHVTVVVCQRQKWGQSAWEVCLKCGGKRQSYVGTIYSHPHMVRMIEWQKYETARAGHKLGAKIEYGPPTLLGRDYEQD